MRRTRSSMSMITVLGMFALTCALSAQESGVGLPFLKIGIGARQAGMGNVFTGVGDDVYTLYWNPGGLGHIRRWQWSGAYNRWFTDVYQASLSYVKQFRFLGSRKLALGVETSYVGMPSWDATGGREAPVSAGHIQVGAGLGYRLDWISPTLSLGAHVRGISSRLDTYKAEGIATDAGIMYKSPRFRIGKPGRGLFDYGIVTFGVAVLHIGQAMTFDVDETLFPRTIRAGGSLAMGRHRGFSLLLASDAIGVTDRDWTFAVAAEIWWRHFLGARIGYSLNGMNLGDLSFGFGLKWDDVVSAFLGLPTRFGDAVEINVAGSDYGTALQQTYRGSFSHYPVAPEPFRAEKPRVVTSHTLGEASEVLLEWEVAPDPDPFDEVGYLLFIDKDKARVERSIRLVERDMDGFLSSGLRDSLHACEFVPGTSYAMAVSEGGVYHWAVAAYDLGHHARLAKRGTEKILDFVIGTPDLLVRSLRFDPTPWITTTPEQGVLAFVVANDGPVNAEKFGFIVTDMFGPVSASGDTSGRILIDAVIDRLAAGDDTTFQIPWRTPYNGPHLMVMELDPEKTVFELNRDNNIRNELVVSVPKGVVISEDSVEVMATGYNNIDISLVPEVYFTPYSSILSTDFYAEGQIPPAILNVLSERLIENPDITLEVLGSIDAMAGEEDTTLAEERARNVKARLVAMGVPASQVEIVTEHPELILGAGVERDDPDDQRWVSEQNRVVGFRVPREHEEKMFSPYSVAVDTMLRGGGIPFEIRILSPGQTVSWYISAEPGFIEISRAGMVWGDSLSGDMDWDGMDANGVIVPRNRKYRYALVMSDTLGRTFYSRPDSIFLRESRTLQRWEMFGTAKFDQTEPVYQFYWDRMMHITDELVENPNMRVRIEGHACAIGSEEVNQNLSLRRAQAFTNAMKSRLRQMYPRRYRQIWARIDDPTGYGENVPLTLHLQDVGEILLGDNESPVGRYLNRRIMVLLYKEN